MYYEYDFICIINTKTEDIEKLKNKIIEIIKENKCEILEIKDIGEKKLAYTIRNKKVGYFYFLKIKSNRLNYNPIAKISIKLNTMEEIIKYIIIRTNKE